MGFGFSTFPSVLRGNDKGFMPQRLVEQCRARPASAEVRILPLPYSDAWKGLWTSTVSLNSDGVVVVSGGEKHTGFEFPLDVDSNEYGALRVRMRVSGGTMCRVNWQSDVEASIDQNYGTALPTLIDGDFHEYVFPLHDPKQDRWVGRVSRMHFFPSWGGCATGEIASMELVSMPQPSAYRLTLSNETMEALNGSRPPWKIRVPEQAVLQLSSGLANRAWAPYSTDGVRFQATLDTSSQQGVPLVNVMCGAGHNEEDKRWTHSTVDLSAYAGQEVTVHLNVNALDSREGDFAYWGNPMVFSRKSSSQRPPIILISCDTLRADHLGCYGYDRNTTPHIDAFSRECVLFETAVSPDAWTLPAHMSMLTGMRPQRHGVMPSVGLSERVMTVPEYLREVGYLCAGFTGAVWWLSPPNGYAQGFDRYSTPSTLRDAFEVNRVAMEWLDRCGRRQCFLFLHNYEAHGKAGDLGYELPYGPEDPQFLFFSKAYPAPTFERPDGAKLRASEFLSAANNRNVTVTHAEANYMQALYDDSIRELDQALSELFEQLKARGLYDDALIIVTADHGEAFGEHGRYLHEEVYEACSRVPLLVKFPQGEHAGRKVSEPVQLTDFLATIADVAGVSRPLPKDGISLLRVLDDPQRAHQYVYTRRDMVDAIRNREWKLCRNGVFHTYELYNLISDPREEIDLFETSPDIAKPLQERLEAYLAETPMGWHFLFRGGAAHVSARVLLATNGEFTSARFVDGEESDKEKLMLHEDGHSLSATVDLTTDDRDELVVTVRDNENPVFVQVSNEGLLSVEAGPESLRGANRYASVLSPTAYPYGKAGVEVPNKADATTLDIWLVRSRGEQERTAGTSPEEAQQLKALGYL